MPTIADRLKAAIEAHNGKLETQGKKQESVPVLAEIAGVSKQTLYNWLDGQVSRIDPEALEKLADHMGTSFYTLMTGKPEPTRGMDTKALESALTALDVYSGELGASLPQEQRLRLLKRFYSLATIGRLDRTVAEALILDAIRSPLPE